MARTKSTPCVGICSTTYGDLVCRGCKRFAHEIVAWNGYEAGQKARIWARLNGLRDQVIAQVLRVVDLERLQEASTAAGVCEVNVCREPEHIYQLLGYLVARGEPLSCAGLVSSETPEDLLALDVLQRVDSEVFSRSVAHYERNFKVRS